MIEAEGLELRRGGRALLSSVSCRVEPGQVLAIVGPNGAGKTTLLRLLTGEHTPSAGRVLLNGRPLASYAPDELARVRAYLPQQSSLDFDFTVAEVVLLGRTPHALGRGFGDAHEIVQRALERAGVAELAQRVYTTLSGGEQQRVHLARVLAQIWHPPSAGSRVLLLDEPTSSLDLGHQHQILDAVRRFAREQTAVAMVVHDLNLAARYADRVLLLHGGRVLASGDADEVLCPEHIQTAFGVRTRALSDPELGARLLVALEP